jgi:hydroxyacylglutathione hydrolase
LTVDPNNQAALDYQDAVARTRAVDAPTLPSPLSLEIRINPFLRCDTAVIRAAAEAHAGKPLPEASDVFAVLRAWKDKYR